MTKIKPYSLDWKILQILKEFRYANIEGLSGAVEGHYSIHTVRKTVKKMEDNQLIYSVRDDNKRKVYALTEKGKDYLNNINIKFGGLDEAKYSKICLQWGNSMGGRTTINNLPMGIDALNVNEDGEFTALVIENNNESFKELENKLESIGKGNISFKKIYIVLFNLFRENLLPSKIGETEIKIFRV